MHINQLAWISSQAMRQSKPQTMSSTELVIAHQASAQVRVGGTRRYSTLFRSSVDLPRSQSSCPVEASRLQLTQASERAAGAQASSTPTAINQAERRKENIRVQQSLLVGHQLKPEQCSKRSGSQGQSEPLIFEGTDHVASAAAPINRAFSKKPTSADPLSPNR